MKHSFVSAIIAGAASFMTGCMSQSTGLPGALPLGDIRTTATYEVLGPATGSSSGMTCLGFIPFGGEAKRGSIGGGSLMMKPVEAAAVYNAIESVPGADAIISPRWMTHRENYILFSKDKAIVRGKAIRINPAPPPATAK